MRNAYYVRILPNNNLDYRNVFKDESEIEKFKLEHPEYGNFQVAELNGESD